MPIWLKFRQLSPTLHSAANQRGRHVVFYKAETVVKRCGAAFLRQGRLKVDFRFAATRWSSRCVKIYRPQNRMTWTENTHSVVFIHRPHMNNRTHTPQPPPHQCVQLSDLDFMVQRCADHCVCVCTKVREIIINKKEKSPDTGHHYRCIDQTAQSNHQNTPSHCF